MTTSPCSTYVEHHLWKGPLIALRISPRALVPLLLVAMALQAPAALASSATLALSSTDGPPTSQTAALGNGFEPLERVDLSFDGFPLGKVGASASGTFRVSIRIPAAATPGDHTVAALGEHSGSSADAGFLVQTDWSQLGFDASRTHHDPFENVISPSTVSGLHALWSVAKTYSGGEPVVAEGVIITNNGTLPAELLAFDEDTGLQLWSYTFALYFYVSATPTVVDGVVYVQVVDYEGIKAPRSYAFDLHTGAVLHSGGRTVGTPAFRNGRLYDVIGGVLLAMDPSTWHTVWHLADQPYSTPVAVEGQTLFVADSAGGLNAVDAATGTPLWRTLIPTTPNGWPSVEDGVVCIASWAPSFRGGTYYGVDAATGEILWTLATDINIGACTLGDGSAYVAEYDFTVPLDEDHLHALDARTGVERWVITADFSGSVVAGGVLFQTEAGHPVALDPVTGAMLWTTTDVAIDLIVVNGHVIADSGSLTEYGPGP